MAWNRDPVYGITVSVEDRDKETATMDFYVDTVNTILEIDTAVTTYFRPRIAAITNGIVRRVTVTTSWSDDDPALPIEASDVERKGAFSFRAANSASYRLEVPSFRNELVIDRSRTINTADPAVAAFVELVTSPTLLALVRPRTYLGSDITALESAEKIFRSRRRARR